MEKKRTVFSSAWGGKKKNAKNSGKRTKGFRGTKLGEKKLWKTVLESSGGRGMLAPMGLQKKGGKVLKRKTPSSLTRESCFCAKSPESPEITERERRSFFWPEKEKPPEPKL